MKYAIITGAAGGLANQIINNIVQDFEIIAIDKSERLNKMYEGIDKIHSFVCDITDVESLNDLKEKVKEITSRIDLIINFAGIVMLGSVLEIESKKVSNLLNVNVLGMYNVNQCFFEMLDKQSRIINVSSDDLPSDTNPLKVQVFSIVLECGKASTKI